jgi:hypothetical protein
MAFTIHEPIGVVGQIIPWLVHSTKTLKEILDRAVYKSFLPLTHFVSSLIPLLDIQEFSVRKIVSKRGEGDFLNKKVH